MQDFTQRQLGYISPQEQDRLTASRVAILGLGGVGGVVAELLARAGLGGLNICDGDQFEVSNLNRQVGALHSTLGQDKAQVVAQRLLDINPQLSLKVWDPVPADGQGLEPVLSGCSLAVLALDALRPAIQVWRAARSLGLFLVEALGLPVVQVRVWDPTGPDPEQGWPSQGRDLAELDDQTLGQAYLAAEAGRLKDGRGEPLAFSPSLALAAQAAGAAPSLGPLVWLAGALASLEAIKIILGRGRPAGFPGACLDPCAWRLHLSD